VGFLKDEIRFGRYRFHTVQGLTRGKQEIRITPKSLGVLRVLLERAGEVVTRDELFRAVWPDTAVSDAALTSCIQELRRALADDPRQPKYIETLHRRGFRFLAGSVGDASPSFSRSQPCQPITHALGPIVGRDSARAQLTRALAEARAGRRQTVFVTGEPGIGKTALLDVVLTPIDDGVARAECVEHHGAGEAYQPLLDALTRLCTQSPDDAYLTVLRRCAPTWLTQLPALQSLSERHKAQPGAVASTPERMLRELTDALEMMSRRAAIVVCLEDLHWSDESTLEWIAAFARRREPARVLVMGTFRPGVAADGTRSPDALVNELAVNGQCVELALPRLDAAAVHEYITTRFPPSQDEAPLVDRLATAVHRRTDGNPLFIVNALADLCVRQVLVEREGRWATTEGVDEASLGIPADIQRTIERQIDRLDETDRHLLEIASLTGTTCAAAAVAAGAGVPVADVEATFDRLARRHAFLRQADPVEWPDGTLSGGFEFLHALYRDVLSARPSPARRAELHRLIGTRLEAAHGPCAIELAGELAQHFEHARDFDRTVMYLQHAAETDRSRSALDPAERHYRRALTLLDKRPRSGERDEREVALRIGLGNVLMQTVGWGALEVEAVYARVRELAEARGDEQPLVPALWNLWIYFITRGELCEARALANRLSVMAEQSGDPELALQAHHAQWSTVFMLGELEETRRHTREGLILCERMNAASLAYGGHDTGICARVFAARVVALEGHLDEAKRMCATAEGLARDLDHPFTTAFTLTHVAAVCETADDAMTCRLKADEATDVAREHGLRLMLGWATCFLGWATAQLGDSRQGLAMLDEGVRIARATGALIWQSHMIGLLARAQHAAGLAIEALRSVEDARAIANQTGERFYLSRLCRLEQALRAELPQASRKNPTPLP
jgi:DNA-binding winged helix-turn-helix (wHTH) protein/predicted ATPase